jgi:cytochrome c553
MKSLFLVATIAFMPSVGQADASEGEKKAQLCLICHKLNSPSAYVVPTLEGQTREYLYNQMKVYKERRRPDPAMRTNIASLSDKDMHDIADYFTSRAPVRGSYQLDTEKVARGKSKADSLECATCHMSSFSGRKEAARLAGADPGYVALQIIAFTEGTRSHPWIDVTSGISGNDAEDLAQYFAQLE